MRWTRYEAYNFERKRTWTRRTVFFLLKLILISAVLFGIINATLLATYRTGSVSMAPGLSENDRVMASPLVYGIRVPFLPKNFHGIRVPERGDIAVVVPPTYPETRRVVRWFDPVVRFFTLQRASLVKNRQGKNPAKYSIKRVIGVPGDVVRMENFIAHIRPQGSSGFVTEFSLTAVEYDIVTELTASGWSEDLPFSGDMPEVLLGPDEYFVLADNRPNSSDSRSWGPLTVDDIRGKVIFRYWPFSTLGKP